MSAATEWHGIAVVPPGGSPSNALHVGPVPGRKRIALNLVAPTGHSRVLAYFRDEASAQAALAWLEHMAAFVGWSGSMAQWPEALAVSS